METVIAALLVITVALVGGLLIAEQSLNAQESVMLSWQTLEARAEERAGTVVSIQDAESLASGAIVEFSLANTGTTMLADFDTWDLIVQYESVHGDEIAWLPYVEGEPGQSEWTVVGIYLDAASATPEVYDPGIVNAGETMVVRARLQPPVMVGSTNLVTIVTGTGLSATTVFVR